MDIRFPGPLSVEIGTMYKRIDQQGPVVTILGYTCLECEEGPVAIRTAEFRYPGQFEKYLLDLCAGFGKRLGGTACCKAAFLEDADGGGIVLGPLPFSSATQIWTVSLSPAIPRSGFERTEVADPSAHFDPTHTRVRL
jgi:hypothetical protein